MSNGSCLSLINVAKVYKSTNFFLLKKNNFGNTGSIATSSSFFPVAMEQVLHILFLLDEKSVFLYCLCETGGIFARFIFVTNMINLTFAMWHGIDFYFFLRHLYCTLGNYKKIKKYICVTKDCAVKQI